jgi:hypothetical protein
VRTSFARGYFEEAIIYMPSGRQMAQTVFGVLLGPVARTTSMPVCVLDVLMRFDGDEQNEK